MEITSDTALWNYVHRLFGIGDWDELLSTEPFWVFRQREVGRLKARRTRRKVDLADLVLAADFCKARGIDIRNATWLFEHVPAARAWRAERERALSAAHLDELIAEAVDLEYAMGAEGTWVTRLLRARGEHRKEVYQAWKEARSKALASSPSSLAKS